MQQTPGVIRVRAHCMRGAKECLGLNAASTDVAQVAVTQPWGCPGHMETSIYTALCVFQVDKETNTESLAQSSTVVRPKDKRAANPPQSQFVRGSTIIRSKTFSPGPQSQYVCRVRTVKP